MTYPTICRVFFRETLHFYAKNILLAVAIFPFLTSAGDFSSTILSQDQNHIRIKYNFDKPHFESTSDKTTAVYSKSISVIDGSGAELPVINEFISLPGTRASVQIISKKQKSQKVSNYLLVEDAQKTNYPIADIKYMGLYRDVSVFSLSIMPVHYDARNSELIWTEELVLEIRNTSEIIEKEKFAKKTRDKNKLNNIFVKDIQLYQQQLPAKTFNLSDSNPVIADYTIVYQIRIDKTGFYKITYDDLSEANFPVDQVNPKNLLLFNKDSEIPVYFEGSEDNRFDSKDYFEFWAEKNEKTFIKQYSDQYSDPFSDENIYWLVEGLRPGRRMVEESGGIVEANPARYIIPFRYKEKLHFEQDTHWERSGYNPEFIDDVAYKYDNWYWGNRINAVSSKSYEFDLPHPFEQGANVFVTAMFRGASIPNTVTNQMKGHQLSVWLNDEKVGDFKPEDQWLGQKKAQLTNSVALSQANLINGSNTLRINMDQEGVTDIVLFNWFNIEYYRKYRADKNTIKFRLQDDLFNEKKTIQFQVDGFKNNQIQVYKLGVSKIVNGRTELFRDTDDNFTSNRIIFQDQVYDPDIEYLAITNDAKLKPKAIEEYIPWKTENPSQTLWDKSNSADLIIVTHANFIDQAQRLKNIKDQKGFITEVVTTRQIYDTFNYGIKSPLAIKEFLKYVYYSWNQSKKLKYVILAGDASYDYKSRVAHSNDLVPTIMFSTNNYGAAPADIQYACLSGNDLIPDISVGRIPASTASEFSAYIDKIEEYENNTDFGVWRNKALFISGNDENDFEKITNKPVFRSQNNRMLNLKLPQSVFGYKLNVIENTELGSNDPDFGGNRDLLDYFDDGLTFVNFFGHGGGNIWSDKQLLNLDGVDDLNNAGKYPFISSMTCFTGTYENPAKEGLAEKLIMAEARGAIAALASSSVGWKYNDFAIQWGLHDYLWQDNMTFGEAVDNMKIAYMANSIYYTERDYWTTDGYYLNNTAPLWSSMVNQYNLLGDPTLQLLKPNTPLHISISDVTPSAGETITIKISSSQNSAVGYVEVSDSQNRKYLDNVFSFNSAEYTMEYTVPSLDDDSLIVGRLFKVKAYINDGNSGASGNSDFMVEGSIINSITTSPANPQVNEKVDFDIIAKSHVPIAHMELRKFREESSAGQGQVTVVMSQLNDSLFRSFNQHPGFASEGTYLYEIYIRDEDGKEQRYDLNKIIVNDNRPDLILDPLSLKYTGVENLLLSFKVNNSSDVDLDSVRVTTFMGLDTLPFYSEVLAFNSAENKIFNIPLANRYPGTHETYKIYIDPENKINERSENNNTLNKAIISDHIFINQAIGSSVDGIQNSVVNVLQKWDFFVDKNSISRSTVVAFKDSSVRENIIQRDQKDLKFLLFKNNSDSAALFIDFKNSLSEPVATISAYLDSSQDLSQASFFRFDNFLGLWSKIESSTETITMDGKISAQINKSGLYAVFSSTDDDIPFIEVTANGRPLRDNILVKSKPALAFLLQDENGVDFRNTFTVYIDDQPIPADELTIPDSLKNANSVAILATPSLEEGTHTIDVFVSDVNKNASSVHHTFKVSAENKLIVYGNYPNPFETSTIIAYYNDFGNNLSKIKTKIYSVSGHLVRSKKLDAPDGISDYDPTETDYRELVWDGTDDDGNEVANGVYFITLEARYVDDFSNKTSTYKKVLKVAKLK